MGSNAVVGAGFILLACLTAQGEQIVELLGTGGKRSHDTAIELTADGDDDGGEDLLSPELGAETLPLSFLDECDREPSTDVQKNDERILLSVEVERLPSAGVCVGDMIDTHTVYEDESLSGGGAGTSQMKRSDVSLIELK